MKKMQTGGSVSKKPSAPIRKPQIKGTAKKIQPKTPWKIKGTEPVYTKEYGPAAKEKGIPSPNKRKPALPGNKKFSPPIKKPAPASKGPGKRLL